LTSLTFNLTFLTVLFLRGEAKGKRVMGKRGEAVIGSKFVF
jgi:hypothetical protein